MYLQMGIGGVVGAEHEAAGVPRDDGGAQRRKAEFALQTVVKVVVVLAEV